jgi:hypothetical protein
MGIKVTQMEEITEISDDDVIYVINDPNGTPQSKQISLENFISSLSFQIILMQEIFS